MFSLFHPFRKRAPMLPEDVQAQMVAAIQRAEARTTGEIRVFVEHHCTYMDPMHRAHELFTQLGMEKTEHRNAVIVYLAIKDRQFAILGDKEIYELAGGPVFWMSAASLLKDFLREDKIAEGLCACIDALGDELAEHFPHDPSIKKNELPDEIVFGK